MKMSIVIVSFSFFHPDPFPLSQSIHLHSSSTIMSSLMLSCSIQSSHLCKYSNLMARTGRANRTSHPINPLTYFTLTDLPYALFSHLIQLSCLKYTDSNSNKRSRHA